MCINLHFDRVIWTCYKGMFDAKNFWEQTSRLKSSHLSLLLEKEWRNELQIYGKKK